MKRKYMKPAAEVIVLHSRQHLLAGSGVSGEISGYSSSGSGFSQTDNSRGGDFTDDDQ